MEVKEIPGSEFQLKADLVLLAMGFLGPRKAGMIEQSGVGLDPRGNVAANVVDYKSSVSGVCSCGDMRRDRKRVVYGTSVSVRVDLGGRRSHQTTKTLHKMSDSRR